MVGAQGNRGQGVMGMDMVPSALGRHFIKYLVIEAAKSKLNVRLLVN